MITQRSQLALKVEATEGTAETLAVANTVLCENLAFSADISAHERNTMRSTLSRYPAVIGARSGTISGRFVLKGSGTAGTAPEFGTILKACGMTETIVAVTSVTYTPVTGDPNSGTSYTAGLIRDGKLFSLVGCRGTAKFTFDVNGPGYGEFELRGALADIDDLALLASEAYQTTVPPPFNGVTFTYDSYAALISKLEIDLNNSLAMRPDCNKANGYRSCAITGRNPTMRMDPEELAKATYDFYAKILSANTAALTFVMTVAAGNILTVSVPKGQMVGYGSADREGLLTIDLGMKPTLSAAAGDDEISLAFT